MATQKPTPAKSKIETTTVEAPKVKQSEPIHYNKPLMFGKMNYQMLILGVVIILVGFALMAGGAHTDPNVFNGDEKYSFRRITLAPIVVMLGFAIEIVACFWGKNKA